MTELPKNLELAKSFANDLPKHQASYIQELEAMAEQLQAENATLKAHNRQLVAALESINQLATEKRKAHSGPCGQDSLSMARNQAAYQLATEFKKIALVLPQTPPAKLAQAEAEVLRAAEYLARNTDHELDDIVDAVEAMQEARNGSDT